MTRESQMFKSRKELKPLKKLLNKLITGSRYTRKRRKTLKLIRVRSKGHRWNVQSIE